MIEAALASLDQALLTDLPWVREHTRLGELARRWDERRRARSATLRGADLEAAERWLDRRPADGNAPTELHQDFIRASRRAASLRQRIWVGGSWSPPSLPSRLPASPRSAVSTRTSASPGD